MSEQWYAVVFQRTFPPGTHWSDTLPARAAGERFVAGQHRVPAEDTDRRQAWQDGDLWATGTVVADPLPDHLRAIPIEPPRDGQVWDRELLAFVDAPHAPE